MMTCTWPDCMLAVTFSLFSFSQNNFSTFSTCHAGIGSIRAQARRRIRYIVFATGVFSPATFSTFCCIETEYSSIEFHLLNTTAKCLKLSWLILKSLLFDNKVSIQFVVLLLYTHWEVRWEVVSGTEWAKSFKEKPVKFVSSQMWGDEISWCLPAARCWWDLLEMQ